MHFILKPIQDMDHFFTFLKDYSSLLWDLCLNYYTDFDCLFHIYILNHCFSKNFHNYN
jgi:hypothetical protein